MLKIRCIPVGCNPLPIWGTISQRSDSDGEKARGGHGGEPVTWRKTFIIALLLGLVSTAATAAPPKEAPAVPAPSAPAAKSPSKPAPAPVILEGKTLFQIKETVFSVTPEERARGISERLAKLVQNRALRTDSIRVVNDEMVSLIVVEGTVLLRVFDMDAAAEGTTRQALAARFAEAIRAAIEAHNEAYSFRSLLFGAIYAVVATIVLIAILFGYRYLFSRLYPRIRALRETRIRSVRIQSFEILQADRIVWLLVTLARWLRILTTAVFVYSYLLFVLTLFPWTRGIAETILDYILDPLRAFGAAILSSLPDLFLIAVVAVITRFFIKLARFFFDEVERGRVVLSGFYADWAKPTYKIVRFFILAFALTVAFPYIPGSKSEAFKGVSIFLGVLFSLGSTSTISNAMAGLSITYMRAFQVGDRVRIGDTVGDVIDQSLLVTHVRTIKNEDVTVPNAMVLNAHIVNYSARAREEGLILHTAVTIGYDAPWRTVHELLIEAARKTPCILVEPKPFVLQTALNDFYVTYELNAHTDEPRQMVNTYSALHRHIQDTFNEAGVEIMSPHYAQLRDGNKTAIPDAYLPKEYVPRSIRVETVPGDRSTPGEGDGEPAGKRSGGGGPVK
jgi:small-conductance mechanosensitive channel